jgi:hypothetical protein
MYTEAFHDAPQISLGFPEQILVQAESASRKDEAGTLKKKDRDLVRFFGGKVRDVPDCHKSTENPLEFQPHCSCFPNSKCHRFEQNY